MGSLTFGASGILLLSSRDPFWRHKAMPWDGRWRKKKRILSHSLSKKVTAPKKIIPLDRPTRRAQASGCCCSQSRGERDNTCDKQYPIAPSLFHSSFFAEHTALMPPHFPPLLLVPFQERSGGVLTKWRRRRRRTPFLNYFGLLSAPIDRIPGVPTPKSPPLPPLSHFPPPLIRICFYLPPPFSPFFFSRHPRLRRRRSRPRIFLPNGRVCI